MIAGITLIAVPNSLLSLLGLPAAREVWIHIVGVLTLILGYYFIRAARREMIDFMRWTIHARLTFHVFLHRLRSAWRYWPRAVRSVLEESRSHEGAKALCNFSVPRQSETLQEGAPGGTLRSDATVISAFHLAEGNLLMGFALTALRGGCSRVKLLKSVWKRRH